MGNMKVKEAVEEIARISAKWQKRLVECVECEEGANEKHSWAEWATWHLQDILVAERLVAEWRVIENAAKQAHTHDDAATFLGWLKGVRGQYVGWIMQSTLSRSTNLISNLVKDIEMDTYKMIAGHGFLDSDSLFVVIAKMEREKE